MGINLSNFYHQNPKIQMIDFQDLDHVDGLSIWSFRQICIRILEMIYQCFILGEQTILLFIRSQKLYQKILNGI